MSRLIPLLSLVALPGVFAGLTGCTSKAQPHVVPPKPVSWIEVGATDRPRARRYPGVVHAALSTRLSFEVPGRVTVIEADVGDLVEADQVLATLDPRTFKLQVAARRADVRHASAVFSEAKARHRRSASLLAKGANTAEAHDRNTADRETARSRLALARAQLAVARENLADTTLKAPFAGRIRRRPVEPSQNVAVGAPVLEVQSLAAGIEVRVVVPETVVADIRVDARHPVHFPALPDVTLQGRVTEIGVVADAQNAFPIVLHLDAPPAALKPGMTAEVALGSQAPAQLVIPLHAVVRDVDTNAVFVIDSDAVLRRRAVEVGAVSDAGLVVHAGLTPGDRIVDRGLAFLRDGQRVAPLGDGPLTMNP